MRLVLGLGLAPSLSPRARTWTVTHPGRPDDPELKTWSGTVGPRRGGVGNQDWQSVGDKHRSRKPESVRLEEKDKLG